MRLFADYHTHPQGHRVQPYTQALLQPWADCARKMGLNDIAFTDHDRYHAGIDFDEIDRLRERNVDLRIRAGIELDNDPTRSAAGRKWIEKNWNKLDFVLGSVHFLERDDLPKLRSLVEGPMGEYSAAGAEAAKKPPDPVAYKGYTAREDYHKQSGFDVYFPGRVLMGGPDRALARLKEMRDSGITQVSMIVDFGSLPHREVMRSLEVFARDILPKAREL